MRRRRERVRRDIIVRVTQRIRAEEGQRDENEQEDAEAETILRGVIGVERDCVLFVLHLDAGRVVRTRDMQRPYVQDDHTQNHERSEEHTSELQSLMRISYAVFCLK